VTLEVLSCLRQASASLAAGQSPYYKHIVVVTRDGVSCNCTSRDQLDSLCWHCRFGVKYCVENRGLLLLVFDGDSSNGNTVLHKSIALCFHHQDPDAVPTIVMPAEVDLQCPIPVTLFVDVPPRYKNKKSSSTKRLRSLGENGAANVQSSPRSHCSANRVTHWSALVKSQWPTGPFLSVVSSLADRNYFNPFTGGSVSHEEAANLLSRFMPSHQHHSISCGECGEKGHSIRTCSIYLGGGRRYRKPSNIEPGCYIIYRPQLGSEAVPVELRAASNQSWAGQGSFIETAVYDIESDSASFGETTAAAEDSLASVVASAGEARAAARTFASFPADRSSGSSNKTVAFYGSDIEAVTFEEEDSKLPGRDLYDSAIHAESMENALAQMDHEFEELHFREEEGSKVAAAAASAGQVLAIPIAYVAGPAIAAAPSSAGAAFAAAVAAPILAIAPAPATAGTAFGATGPAATAAATAGPAIAASAGAAAAYVSAPAAPRAVADLNLPNIPWSVPATFSHCKIRDTCSLDSTLGLLYILSRNQGGLRLPHIHELTSARSLLCSSLHLIDNNNANEARRAIYLKLPNEIKSKLPDFHNPQANTISAWSMVGERFCRLLNRSSAHYYKK